MTEIMYPFIDLAVHDAIRSRFTSGDALAIVSVDFNTIIWTNGPAARLFNHETIYDFMDEGLIESKKTRKKLRETAQQLIVNKMIKSANLQILPNKDGSELDLTLQLIELPKGEQAVLVIVNTERYASRGILDVDHIISGFADTGICVAVLGKQGQILGATEQFYALDVSLKNRRKMTEDVSTEIDRLVKRPLLTIKGDLPAAIGHLSSNPDMYLLFAIDEDQAPVAIEPDELVIEDDAPIIGDVADTSEAELTQQTGIDLPGLMTPDVQIDEPEIAQSTLEDNTDIVADETDIQTSDDDEILEKINSLQDVVEDEIEPEAASVLSNNDFTFESNQRAVRFVWKTDAAGIFTEISPELGDAIGPNAVDVLGRRFADVALVFNLNPSEEIIDLIRRRDTWSGKTVLWPVQGTNLSVPVDLAALPTYTRDRLFDGYRGFGIARIQEAAQDPQSIGLALTSGSFDQTLEAVENAPKIELPSAHSDTDTDTDTDNRIELIEDPETYDSALGKQDKDTENNDDGSLDDPYRGEVPALDTSGTPKRRRNDKVIQLEELHREAREELTKDEQAAFLEIRKQLGNIGETPDDNPLLDEHVEFGHDDDEITSSFVDPSEEIPVEDNVHVDDDLVEANSDEAPENTDHIERTDGLNPDLDDLELEILSTDQQIDEDQIVTHETNILQLNDNIPSLIYNSETLLFANDAFFSLTGYTDLEELQDLGGIEYLLSNNLNAEGAENDDVDTGEEDPASNHGQVKLSSIQWSNETALMLTFHSSAPDEELPVSDEFIEENERLKMKISDLTSILETATDGVVIIDSDSKIQSLNASASALFDYNADDATGQPFAMLFAAESQNSVLEYVGAMSGPSVASLLNDGREVLGRVSSGGTMPLSMTMGRLSGSEGYCAVLRDISQTKYVEEELQSAKSEAESASSHKSDFLARVSHEIRTPLNAIIGFSDLIAQERFGPAGHPRYNEYAHDIGKSGRHVLDIVNDLLDISKIESGQQDLDFQAVALNDEVVEALSLMQQIANENRVIVRSSLPADVPSVVADKRSIKQILLNILSNSIRFTPAGGQIVVSSSLEPSGHVMLRIRDNGVGMSRVELERAMQPFGQVGQETRQRGDGTGLGLPLTRAMTEANRANFDIVSAPGEGTLVTINFPPQRVLAE